MVVHTGLTLHSNSPYKQRSAEEALATHDAILHKVKSACCSSRGASWWRILPGSQLWHADMQSCSLPEVEAKIAAELQGHRAKQQFDISTDSRACVAGMRSHSTLR